MIIGLWLLGASKPGSYEPNKLGKTEDAESGTYPLICSNLLAHHMGMPEEI